MIDPGGFRELVSGRRRGPLAGAARLLLRAAETPYTLVANWRNGRYDGGKAIIHRVGVPVVSVGNLTLGGTGKTPLVRFLAQWFSQGGKQVGIVSRGYRNDGQGLNDEARELRESLPNVPHVQNADRVSAARSAIDYHGCDLILLDDGFQHRRLARDLDIVVIDSLEPFGFDHVFPRGLLREPVAGLRRADVICLSRADAVAPEVRGAIRKRAAALAPRAVWCETRHAARQIVNAAGEREATGSLSGRRVAAFCGIGNPAGFRHTLLAAGCQIAAWREFPDHHAYSDAEIQSLGELGAAAKAECLVCTRKDLVKIRRGQAGRLPLWALSIEIEFDAGYEALEAELKRVLRGGGSATSRSGPQPG